jgi:hypothetical protein
MKSIYNLNRLITIVVISLKSSIGSGLLIASMIFVDSLGSAFAISEIFIERFREINPDQARVFAMLSGAIFSAAMLMAILITSLKPSLRGTSYLLAVFSAILSFVGFALFILPPQIATFSQFLAAINAALAVKIIIAFILAFFPAFTVKGVSDELAEDYAGNALVKDFNKDIQKKVAEHLLKQFEKISGDGEREKSKVVELYRKGA